MLSDAAALDPSPYSWEVSGRLIAADAATVLCRS